MVVSSRTSAERTPLLFEMSFENTWPLMMSSVLIVSAPPGWSAAAFPPRATNSATNPMAHPMALDRR